MLIPMIYTPVFYTISEQTQGDQLREHKALGHPFYSIWRAIGIGIIFLVGTIVTIGTIVLITHYFISTQFRFQVMVFQNLRL